MNEGTTPNTNEDIIIIDWNSTIIDLLKMIEYNTSVIRLYIEKKESPYHIPTEDDKEPYI